MAFWNKRKKKAETAPRFETLRSHNMMLRVPAPIGEGWQRMEAATKGGMLAGFKCLYGTPPNALALDAMLYLVTPDMPSRIEALEARDWRTHYSGGMFSQLSGVAQTRVEHYGPAGFAVQAIELTVDGQMAQSDQALRKVERYALFDDKLLVVSAVAAPEQMSRFALVITSWMGHTTLEQ